jgi:hypothetical protein
VDTAGKRELKLHLSGASLDPDMKDPVSIDRYGRCGL